MAKFKLTPIGEDGVKLEINNVSVKIYQYHGGDIVKELLGKFDLVEPTHILVEKSNDHILDFMYALQERRITVSDDSGLVIYQDKPTKSIDQLASEELEIFTLEIKDEHQIRELTEILSANGYDISTTNTDDGFKVHIYDKK